MEILPNIIKWSDDHSGFLSLILFFAVLLIGWLGGFFRYIRQKPVFKVSVVDGPTFVTVCPDGSKFNGQDTHRIIISLYISISNAGSAPSSIVGISAAYKVPPTSILDLFRSRWHYIQETGSLSDFSRQIGEHLKVYPFLRQKNYLTNSSIPNYYRTGQSHTGVVYFEKDSLAYGSHRPIISTGKAKIKLTVTDAFRKNHHFLVEVPEVTIESARLYSKYIGKSQQAHSEN